MQHCKWREKATNIMQKKNQISVNYQRKRCAESVSVKSLVCSISELWPRNFRVSSST